MPRPCEGTPAAYQLLRAFLLPMADTPALLLAAAVAKDLPLWVECIFVFSLVWSVGGVLDGPSRPKFDGFLRQVGTSQTSPPVSSTTPSPLLHCFANPSRQSSSPLFCALHHHSCSPSLPLRGRKR